MKNNTSHLFAAIICILCLLNSCNPYVDLCYETEHPHHTEIQFQYNWTDTVTKPDSMYILAERVINSWKCGLKVSSDNGTGHFFTGQLPSDSDSVATNGFLIRRGIYKILTFNKDTTVFNYSNLDSASNSLEKQWNFQEFTLNYRSYKMDDAVIKNILNNWSDNNAYSDFVLPTATPMVYDSLELFKIETGNNNIAKFTPIPITQNVTLSFNIHKIFSTKLDGVSFKVDSIKSEISGIPAKINLYTGLIDIRKTYKMVSNMNILNATDSTAKDSYANDSLHCSINYDVTGIAWGNTDDIASGPGIMQVIIYTTINNNGTLSYKKIQGKINLYHTLQNAAMLKYTEDGNHAQQTTKKGNINISTPLQLDGTQIIKASENTSWGIDKWIPTGSTDIIEI